MDKRKSEDACENSKKLKTSVPKVEFDSAVGYIFPSETEITLCNMRKKFPKEKFCNKIPPLIFVHQLWSKINVNPVQVQEEITKMEKDNKIKLLSVNPSLSLIFFIDDLRDVVYSQFNPTGRPKYFLHKVIPSLESCTVEKKLLKSQYKLSERDITELVQFGLLVVHQENTYNVSFPAFGQFMKIFYDGRNALIHMIQKSKYRELLVSGTAAEDTTLLKGHAQLACSPFVLLLGEVAPTLHESSTVRKSSQTSSSALRKEESFQEIKGRAQKPFEMLGFDYHLSDALGAKLVTSIETTSGLLLRCLKP